LGIHTEFKSKDAAAAGNLLANDTIPEAMVTAFHNASGHLGDRLIAAMRAALTAGGEAGPVHSAGFLLVAIFSTRSSLRSTYSRIVWNCNLMCLLRAVVIGYVASWFAPLLSPKRKVITSSGIPMPSSNRNCLTKNAPFAAAQSAMYSA